MRDLVSIARDRPNRIGTHWEGCEEHHVECLISKMADEIEWLREHIKEHLNYGTESDEDEDHYWSEYVSCHPVREVKSND